MVRGYVGTYGLCYNGGFIITHVCHAGNHPLSAKDCGMALRFRSGTTDAPLDSPPGGPVSLVEGVEIHALRTGYTHPGTSPPPYRPLTTPYSVPQRVLGTHCKHSYSTEDSHPDWEFSIAD